MANDHAPTRDVTKWLRLSCLCLKNPMKQKLQQMERGSILANFEVTSFMSGPLCGGHRLRSLGNFLSFQGLQCKNVPSFFLRHWSHFANPFWPYWDFWVLNSKTFWFNLVSFRSIKIYPPKFYSTAILGLSLSVNTILGWVGQKLS